MRLLPFSCLASFLILSSGCVLFSVCFHSHWWEIAWFFTFLFFTFRSLAFSFWFVSHSHLCYYLFSFLIFDYIMYFVFFFDSNSVCFSSCFLWAFLPTYRISSWIYFLTPGSIIYHLSFNMHLRLFSTKPRWQLSKTTPYESF